MNRACLLRGMAAPSQPPREILCAFARRKPMVPAAADDAAIHTSSISKAWCRSRALRVCREPARAAVASKIPRAAPTHHVARIPHCNANNVGEVIGKIVGWATEKYSTQILAVTWSCKIPYVIAAATQSAQIFSVSILWMPTLSFPSPRRGTAHGTPGSPTSSKWQSPPRMPRQPFQQYKGGASLAKSVRLPEHPHPGSA